MTSRRSAAIVGVAAATWVVPILFLVPVLFLAGCGDSGPERGEVTGTVTLDGRPLAEATVVFQPAQGSPSYGETDSQGRYRLGYTADKPGAVVGKHRVSITTARVKGPPGEEVEVPERVPAEYNSQSEVTREVEPGENVFDFSITTSP